MSLSASRVVCVGEGMVEISPQHGGWHVHHGGDTLNVALHLTRLGHRTAYFTALGADPFAGRMRAEWAREGMDISLVLAHPTRTTGLYAIATDQAGERQFSYWRGESAARALFACEGVEQAEEEARGADLLFFSLISLAILPEDEARQAAGPGQGRAGAGRHGRVRFQLSPGAVGEPAGSATLARSGRSP